MYKILLYITIIAGLQFSNYYIAKNNINSFDGIKKHLNLSNPAIKIKSYIDSELQNIDNLSGTLGVIKPFGNEVFYWFESGTNYYGIIFPENYTEYIFEKNDNISKKMKLERDVGTCAAIDLSSNYKVICDLHVFKILSKDAKFLSGMSTKARETLLYLLVRDYYYLGLNNINRTSADELLGKLIRNLEIMKDSFTQKKNNLNDVYLDFVSSIKYDSSTSSYIKSNIGKEKIELNNTVNSKLHAGLYVMVKNEGVCDGISVFLMYKMLLMGYSPTFISGAYKYKNENGSTWVPHARIELNKKYFDPTFDLTNSSPKFYDKGYGEFYLSGKEAIRKEAQLQNLFTKN